MMGLRRATIAAVAWGLVVFGGLGAHAEGHSVVRRAPFDRGLSCGEGKQIELPPPTVPPIVYDWSDCWDSETARLGVLVTEAVHGTGFGTRQPGCTEPACAYRTGVPSLAYVFDEIVPQLSGSMTVAMRFSGQSSRGVCLLVGGADLGSAQCTTEPTYVGSMLVIGPLEVSARQPLSAAGVTGGIASVVVESFSYRLNF